MIKKALVFSLLGAVFFGASNDKPLGKSASGFYNYDEALPTQADNLTDKQILLAILQEQKKQTAIQEEILKIIKKQTGIPEMVTINGKKCLANSSADCFVMPVANDALKIPVMAKWIQNPTVENAKEYYKWQAKAINTSIQAGYSLNFASMAMPYPFYGHQAMSQTGGNDSNYQMSEIIDAQIKKHAKTMEVKILLGKDNFDYNNSMTQFNIYDELKKLGIKVKFVFPTTQALMDYAEFHRKSPNHYYTENWERLPKEDKIVSPSSFSKNDVYITPLYLWTFFDKKNNKSYNQIIGGGYEKIVDVKKRIKNALITFNILKPQDFNTQINATTPLEYNLQYLDKNNPKTKAFEELIRNKIQKTKQQEIGENQ